VAIDNGGKEYIAKPRDTCVGETRRRALLQRHRGQVVGRLPCSKMAYCPKRVPLFVDLKLLQDRMYSVSYGLASFLVGQLTSKGQSRIWSIIVCSQNVAFAKKGRSKNERTRQHGIVQTQECMIRADVPVRCDRSNLIVGTPLGTFRALSVGFELDRLCCRVMRHERARGKVASPFSFAASELGQFPRKSVLVGDGVAAGSGDRSELPGT
jgi:hypothetical protein